MVQISLPPESMSAGKDALRAVGTAVLQPGDDRVVVAHSFALMNEAWLMLSVGIVMPVLLPQRRSPSEEALGPDAEL